MDQVLTWILDIAIKYQIPQDADMLRNHSIIGVKDENVEIHQNGFQKYG